VCYNRNFLKIDFNKLSKEKAYLEAIKTYIIKEIASLNQYIKVL
jgi:hypothetical protein